jgi:hypothetical protein
VKNQLDVHSSLHRSHGYSYLWPVELIIPVNTIEITLPWGSSFTKVLFSGAIWRYRDPQINKKIIDNMKKEEDKSPPDISSFTDSEGEVIPIVNFGGK